MKNPNVVFFTIDGLRADQIFSESKSALTPNIDLLIKKGTLFSNAFSSADGTTLSFNTIFNSLFPFKTGVRTTKIFLGENNIFQTFQKNNYHIFGLLPDMKIYDSVREIFENKLNSYQWVNENESLDTSVANTIINFLDSIDVEPWLFFAHLLDLHPLREGKIPSGLKEFDDERFGSSDYAKTVSGIDFWLGKILKHIDLSNTLLILTADHGERIPYGNIRNTDLEPKLSSSKKIGKKLLPKQTHEMGGKALWKIRSSISKYKIKKINETLTNYQQRSRMPYFTLSLHDEMLHVPLLFVGNGILSRIIPNFVRHVDIFPTLCDLVNINYQKNGMHGTSLSPLFIEQKMEEEPVYLHTMPYKELHQTDAVGIRTKNFKYFRFARDQNKDVHLYDLKNDPFENNNIAESNPNKVKEMESILQNFEKDGFVEKQDCSDEEFKEIEKELKKLGYL
jgi:arylsulfatase A-like enzyme